MIWYMQYIVSGAQTWIISMYINLNIYDFSWVRTFKIGCKIVLVGKEGPTIRGDKPQIL